MHYLSSVYFVNQVGFYYTEEIKRKNSNNNNNNNVKEGIVKTGQLLLSIQFSLLAYRVSSAGPQG
jgi:hypothetical protein